jgi:ubiquinone/menaquinone biosynthesis C-methylase UbiE
MATDKWLDWIVNRRFGGDKKNAEASMAKLNQVRDKVIDSASIKEGDIVLDIGAGDGLIGFAALSLVGPNGKVIFSDISQSCVNACKEIYESMDSPNPAEFIVISTADLSLIQDKSIDVVVFRSVLIYINEKQECFNEFFRVLKPGGRISFFEPINIFVKRHQPKNTIYGYDVAPIKELWEKIRTAQPAKEESADPMMNFDEDDLFQYTMQAGFSNILMSISAYSTKEKSNWNWDLVYKSAPNPNALSLEEIVEKSFSESEKEDFISYMKSKFDGVPATRLFSEAYLNAAKE